VARVAEVRVDGVLDDKLLLEDGTVDHLFLDLDLALDSLGVRLESDKAKNINHNVRFCASVGRFSWLFIHSGRQSVMCSHRSPSDFIHSFIHSFMQTCMQCGSQSGSQYVRQSFTHSLRHSDSQAVRQSDSVRNKCGLESSDDAIRQSAG
jgi:hypothetical protein